MSMTHFDSNLSKIKPKLRTTGQISGNFGKAKVKAGSSLNEIGVSTKETINITKRSDYIDRMIHLFYHTEDRKMRHFAYTELHRLHAI
jgi:hypothetical protein